jgi:hypothetical protein
MRVFFKAVAAFVLVAAWSGQSYAQGFNSNNVFFGGGFSINDADRSSAVMSSVKSQRTCASTRKSGIWTAAILAAPPVIRMRPDCGQQASDV